MFKKKKFIIGGIVIILALSYLGFSSFKSSATYYYKINEVLAQGSAAVGNNIRVEGVVAPDFVQQASSTGRLLNFTISDNVSGAILPVVYTGVVPDTFKTGTDVVVEGTLASNGIFQAQSILTKCPSKYVPATQ